MAKIRAVVASWHFISRIAIAQSDTNSLQASLVVNIDIEDPRNIISTTDRPAR